MAKTITQKPTKRKVSGILQSAQALQKRNQENIEHLEEIQVAQQERADALVTELVDEPLLIWQYGKSPKEMLTHQRKVLSALKSNWPERKNATIGTLIFLLKKHSGLDVLHEHMETLLPELAYKVSYGVWKLYGS